MLEIKKISKSYTTENFTQKALDNVSIKFREKEFVAILGASGSGKTTLLNIVGGLDRYDQGDLIINEKSTKDFKDSDWDAYRNNSVGFVFQSYNLISHISILENVEMGLTLSGVSKKTRRKKSLEVLDKVGLLDHKSKKPNQLSGGQMQRVAIARALVNDPDIILADEPTGALDSKTSIQIMDLIKEIAQEKLVIMVTHNKGLAFEYSNRIIELSDGKVISDSNKLGKSKKKEVKYQLKKTSMSFLTALSLSFNNIKTKKGRTLLTSFAASIGIIGVSLILALSNGFDKQIDIFEANTLGSFPIIINKQAIIMDEEMMQELRDDVYTFSDENKVIPYDSTEMDYVHENNLNEEFINYLEKIDPSLIQGISYNKLLNFNLLIDSRPIQSSNLNMESLAKLFDHELKDHVATNYELLGGDYPKNKEDLLLVLDSHNRVESEILKTLGFKTDQVLDYQDVIGKKITLVSNDDYYQNLGDRFFINQNFQKMEESSDSLELKIVGIVKPLENTDTEELSASAGTTISISTGVSTKGKILYPHELMEAVIKLNYDSKIAQSQRKSMTNVLSGERLNQESKAFLLSSLGASVEPYIINVYPIRFEAKDEILKYLDDYNEGKDQKDEIVYTDLAELMVNISSGIMDAITYILVAFSSVSLIVSSIMIGIITYISVLERTKEIGILRSLGARKKDISRVFNAETFIIGLSSGLLGVLIAQVLTVPINIILYNLTELENIAQLNPVHALIMIIISVVINLIGGLIPSKMAASKDPVIALRTE